MARVCRGDLSGDCLPLLHDPGAGAQLLQLCHHHHQWGRSHPNSQCRLDPVDHQLALSLSSDCFACQLACDRLKHCLHALWHSSDCFACLLVSDRLTHSLHLHLAMKTARCCVAWLLDQQSCDLILTHLFDVQLCSEENTDLCMTAGHGGKLQPHRTELYDMIDSHAHVCVFF